MLGCVLPTPLHTSTPLTPFFFVQGSNAATMATLLGMLEPAADAAASAKPIIIIVDEFDLFALHPRQSFLYCLLDIVQGNRRKAGMGVIGLSARTVRRPFLPPASCR